MRRELFTEVYYINRRSNNKRGLFIQCLPDLTNSVLTNHPGLTNGFLASNIFLLHKNFSKFPGLTNNWLGPDEFVKSGGHCTFEQSIIPPTRSLSRSISRCVNYSTLRLYISTDKRASQL